MRIFNLSEKCGLYAAVILTFLSAGCAGPSHDVVMPRTPAGPAAPAPPAAASAMQAATFTLKIPLAKGVAADRRGQYVSPGTRGLAISAYSALATPPPTPGTVLDISAANTAQCTTTPTGRTCSVTFPAPVGNDLIAVTMLDTAPSGGVLPTSAKVLSTVTVPATVAAFATNAFSFTLGGAVAAISIVPGTINLAPQAGVTTVSVNALDAAGYTIVGTDAFVAPISIGVSGGPPGAFSVSPATLTAPGQTVALTYNGAAFKTATLFASSGSVGATATVQQGTGTAVVPVGYRVGAFAAGTTADRVVTYAANASATLAPTTTLQGPMTPLSIGTDSGGNLWTLLSNAGAYQIGVFLSGKAFGAVTPDKTFTDAVNFCRPQAIAVTGNFAASANLYVADACGKVLVYSLGTASATTLSPVGNYPYSAVGPDPGAIRADAAGNILLADRSLKAVLLFPAATPNVPITALTVTGIGPTGLELDGVGGLYVGTVTGTGSGAIQHYSNGSGKGAYGALTPNQSTSTCEGGQLAAPSANVLVALTPCSSTANLYNVYPASSPMPPITPASPPSFTGPDFDFSSSVAGAGSSTGIWASSPALQRIDSYTATGMSNGAYTLGSLGLHAPQGVALDASGNVFVADGFTNAVSVYAAGATGAALATRQLYGPYLQQPRGIAVDAGGSIYVASAYTNTVSVFAPGANGNVTPIRQYSQSISAPSQIALDSLGTLYVLNAGNGTVTYYAGSTNLTGTLTKSLPGGIALDSQNNLIVAESSAGNTLINVYSGVSSTTVLRSITGPNTGLTAPGHLAVDQYGNILMHNGNSVLVFGPGASGNVAPVATFPLPGTVGVGLATQPNQAVSGHARSPQASGGRR